MACVSICISCLLLALAYLSELYAIGTRVHLSELSALSTWVCLSELPALGTWVHLSELPPLGTLVHLSALYRKKLLQQDDPAIFGLKAHALLQYSSIQTELELRCSHASNSLSFIVDLV